MPLAPEIRQAALGSAAMTAIPQALPDDGARGVAATFAQVQGVMLHQHWAGAYAETLTLERIAQTQLRPNAALIDWLGATGAGPLAPRPAGERIVGVCRHFSTLAVGLLRRQGVPARARCGFALYFDGTPVDHWVVEYWDEAADAWKLGDAQLDETQRRAIGARFDPLDTPRDAFLVAGEGWRRCRAGEDDPQRYGIMDLRGLWFVAGNVVRDLAALNDAPMLPWDVWGAAMFESGQTPTVGTLARLDRIAALTLDPDANWGELRALYQSDADLRVPAEVLNALTQRMEPALGEALTA